LKKALEIRSSDINSIPRRIEELCKKSIIIKEQIKKVRDDTIFNIGKSVKVGAEEIIKLLNQLKNEHSQDKLD